MKSICASDHVREKLSSGSYKCFAVGKEGHFASPLAIAFEFDFDYVTLGRPVFATLYRKQVALAAVDYRELKRVSWTRKLPTRRELVVVDGREVAEAASERLILALARTKQG